MNRSSLLLPILVAAVSTPAPGQSSSLRVGYVIVTPTFGDFSRLTAFETFRFQGRVASAQASVLDSTLTTNASVFVSSDSSSERNFGIALVNPGDSSVDVSATLYRANGSQVAVRRVLIQPEQQLSLFITELFAGEAELRSGFAGLVNLVSTSPIGIVGLRFQDQDFSPVPVVHNLPFVPMVPPHLNGAGGPGAVLLPQFVAGDGWSSEIVLTNTSIAPITVRVDIFNASGGALAVPLTTGIASTVTGITIPPNGSFVLATAY